MIPVLYKADALTFTSYGLGALSDCVSCEVTEERNGAFELTMKYPVTGHNYGQLANERIIKAKPNDTGKGQAFRIYRITTPINGVVTVYAQRLSHDLSNIAALQWEDAQISPALALDQIFQNTATPHHFTCQTDQSTPRAFSIRKPQSVRACLGGAEGSMLDVWGGEYEWDNWTVKLHSARGRQTGVVIEYGKNLTEMEHDADSTDVYTDLLPYAVQTDDEGTETIIMLSEVLLPITNSEMIRRKTLIKDFSSFFDFGTEITEERLRAKALSYLSANPLGVTMPTLTVKFEPLWKQPEYATLLERVSLCDTVTVRHSALGITAKAKVIKTVYDTLEEQYVSITLGQAKANLINTVTEAETAAAQAQQAAAKVDRFPAIMAAAIQNATALITGQTGGYVVIHTDETTGQPYELLIMDAPSIEEAENVWRWNVGGLGFSRNGYAGPYETAITADGQIVADFITSGTLVANIIKAGVLSSQDGSSWWDLETGEVHLRAYATTESVGEASGRIDAIEAQKMYRLIITSTHGNIFKNNNIQTTLSAIVFSWDENVTDSLDPNQFIWTRVSDDPVADQAWNDAHFGGTKSVEITRDDVKVKATFFCDLIDTTTRHSLLG